MFKKVIRPHRTYTAFILAQPLFSFRPQREKKKEMLMPQRTIAYAASHFNFYLLIVICFVKRIKNIVGTEKGRNKNVKDVTWPQRAQPCLHYILV